jgi:hypothetical protein
VFSDKFWKKIRNYLIIHILRKEEILFLNNLLKIDVVIYLNVSKEKIIKTKNSILINFLNLLNEMNVLFILINISNKLFYF